MKILTYEDYLNSNLIEIDNELSHSFLYNEEESQNLILFMDKFAEEIGKYEDILIKNNIKYNKERDITEKCINILNRYKELTRDIN